MSFKNSIRVVIFSLLLGLTACAQLVEKPLMSFSENLTAAVLDQNDPELVREGAPTFLLLMDGLIRQSPENPALRGAAAQLYSLYNAAFVDDVERSKKLADSAFAHGSQAYCLMAKIKNCDLNKVDFDIFEKSIAKSKYKDLDSLSALSTSWLIWIRSNADDWSAIAQLPKAELALNRIVELDGEYGEGTAKMYLGIVNSIRPPALGGKPELAKKIFR